VGIIVGLARRADAREVESAQAGTKGGRPDPKPHLRKREIRCWPAEGSEWCCGSARNTHRDDEEFDALFESS